MNIFIVIRMAIEFVLCVAAWYLVPWPVALLLAIMVTAQELQFLGMRRLICFVATVQNMHRNTPTGGAGNGRKAGQD